MYSLRWPHNGYDGLASTILTKSVEILNKDITISAKGERAIQRIFDSEQGVSA